MRVPYFYLKGVTMSYVSDYRRERRRIQNFIRRNERRGFIFDGNILPTIPKRITKASVRRLKKITPEYLYKHSRYGGEASQGEIISGVRGRELERSQSAKKAARTRKRNREAERSFWTGEEQPLNGYDTMYNNLLDNFIARLSAPTSSYTIYGSRRKADIFEQSENERLTLYTILQTEIQLKGIDAVMSNLNKQAERINRLLDIVLYDSKSEMIQVASYTLAGIIQQTPLSLRQRQTLADIEEVYEDWGLEYE